MTLLDIILEPPRMPRIVHRPDTADTILQVDSVKVQHMDLAPPPTDLVLTHTVGKQKASKCLGKIYVGQLCFVADTGIEHQTGVQSQRH